MENNNQLSEKARKELISELSLEIMKLAHDWQARNKLVFTDFSSLLLSTFSLLIVSSIQSLNGMGHDGKKLKILVIEDILSSLKRDGI